MKSTGSQFVASMSAAFFIGMSVAIPARATDDSPSAVLPGVPGIPGLESAPVPNPERSKEEVGAREREAEALEKQQRPLWRALIHNFKVLQKRRSQALAGSQSLRNKHIAALRGLLKQAKALEGSFANWQATINTELRIFGADDPEIFHWINNDDMRVEPKTLVDPKTRVTYKLEADGRHVVAISPKGKILWAHEIFEDFGLEPYRFSKPVIVVFKLSAGSQEEYEAGRKRALDQAYTLTESAEMGFRQREDYSRRFIEVRFNSSQFGSIDTVTGKFAFEGQD
jgi:hypothetical protein